MIFIMKKTVIARPILGFIFLATAFFILNLGQQNSEENWEKEVLYTHAYTKAFCDSSNLCRDFVVFCKDKEIVALSFIGAAIQLQESWQDSRTEEERIGNC